MIFLFLYPLLSLAQIDTELGAYSNFLWRGTTFSQNRPALQAEVEAHLPKNFYFSSFLSNAEFSDKGLHQHSQVTSEIDATLGKRWRIRAWDIQFYYSYFSFPGAGVFDTDEWNLQFRAFGLSLELSVMDDYFGYHSRATYLRLGRGWSYDAGLDGALFVGLNTFDRSKGHIRSRIEKGVTFETLDGAGNSDYVDVFFVNQKTFENQMIAELSFNWTNRFEYTVEEGEIKKNRAKDFAAVVALIFPFSL
jgi:hypothetical protein